MNRPEVTHAILINSHAAETHRRIADLPVGQVVLHLHDATELDFTSKTTLLDHLGQIGQGSRRGYICHNSLTVRADTGETLGLSSQILHHRADIPEGETTKEKREREDRESRLWIQGAAACGAVPTGIVGIDVSDSLSDTFEYMASEVTQQRGFVLRAKENRKLETPLNGEWYLLDAVRSLPASGKRQVEVLPSPKRKGRTATVKVSFAAVHLALPRKHLGEYAKAPLSLWAVRIWEPNTPSGEDPLEWILLTNVSVTKGTEAQERADWYACRPVVEIDHADYRSSDGLYLESVAA